MTVGGNIGAPLSAQVDDSTPDTLHVVETSSFQLEQIDTFHPWIAVMLNFSPDHLDRHPTVEAYAAAKARIFENQDARDWAVVNADDPGGARAGAPRPRGGAAVRAQRRDRPRDGGQQDEPNQARQQRPFALDDGTQHDGRRSSGRTDASAPP